MPAARDSNDAWSGKHAPSGRSADLILQADAITRRFDSVVAVDRLTFDVTRGELFGLVGPDGAGKTTTLRMLAGVLPPSEGDASILGMSVAREPERVKPHIAYMAQRFGLYEDLTVRENLDFHADLYRVPRGERPARLERLYVFSRLGEFENRLAGALSGGMKQKLALSCCLIHQPDLLLLDEPTFGVDPISRRDLWLILHQMVADGVTVIVSTSYLDEAERCDRVVLLDAGRVLALDAPGTLQGTLPGRLFEVVITSPREARDALREDPDVRSVTMFGQTLHVQLGAAAEMGDAKRILAQHGLAAERVIGIEASLEDVFLDRVGQKQRSAEVVS
ncbi:MAG: ABC transporter ATP-binding protein [Longimicrobiales bacterium]